MKRLLLLLLLGCLSVCASAQFSTRVANCTHYNDSVHTLPLGQYVEPEMEQAINDTQNVLLNFLNSTITSGGTLQSVTDAGSTTTNRITIDNNEVECINTSTGQEIAVLNNRIVVTNPTATFAERIYPSAFTADRYINLPDEGNASPTIAMPGTLVTHTTKNAITINNGVQTVIYGTNGIAGLFTGGADLGGLQFGINNYLYLQNGAASSHFNFLYSGSTASAQRDTLPDESGVIALGSDTVGGTGLFVTATYVASHTVASIPGRFTVNAQTGTTYTVAFADTCANCLLTGTNGSAQNYTIPPNGTTAFPTFSQIKIMNTGAGTITFLAGAGVTIHTPNSDLDLNLLPGNSCFLFKTATNTWWISGGNTP